MANKYPVPLTQYGLYGGHNLNGINPGYLLKAENIAFDDGCMRKEGGAAIYNEPFPYVFTERSNTRNFALNAVIWTGSHFVAVGDADGTDAYLLTSPDGVTWTEQGNGVTANIGLNAVTFGEVFSPNKCIAVGDADGTDAYIVTSADGTTWNERANPKNFALNGVAHNGTTIVAVGAADGTDSYIVTSTDGTTWTERAPTVAKNISLNAVVWAPELSLFIAVGNGDGTDSYILTSPDGTTWTERAPTVAKNIALRSIAWNGTTLVAVGAADGTDGYILTSTDGITWTEVSNPKNFQLNAVFWNGEMFYAAGNADGTDAYMLISSTGATWTEVVNLKNFAINGLGFNGIHFVAVGAADGTDAYLISKQLSSGVTERSNPKNDALNDVIWNDGLFIAVGNDDGADAYILSSPDGATWTERANPADFALNAIVYGAGRLVAAGASIGTNLGPYIVTSSDNGTTWTQHTFARPGNSGIINDLVYNGLIFVGVGEADATDALILTSQDGKNWTERTNPKAFRLTSIAWNGELFVAVGLDDGADAYIITSPDGSTWTERSNPLNGSLGEVVWTGSKFIAGGENIFAARSDLFFSGMLPATYIESTDGVTWTSFTTVTYGSTAGGFSGGLRNHLSISFDTKTWFGIPCTTQAMSINAVAFNNKTLVGVGSSNSTGSDAYLLSMDLSPIYFLGAQYWNYDGSTPKVVGVDSDGRLLMDNYNGIFSTVLDSGHTVTANTFPVFVEGGKEAAANNKKLFIFTGANPVQVLSGSGTTTADLATPPADWAAANQPSGGLIHDERLWGYGNANDPHRLYYSATTSHEDFSAASGGGSVAVYPGQGEKIINAISYKGYIIVFKYPKGIYIVDTTSVQVAGWRVNRLNRHLGGAGQGSAAVVEEDLIFIDHTGEIRTIAGITEYGDIGSRSISDLHDISVFIRDTYYLPSNTQWRMQYYTTKRELHIGASSNQVGINDHRMVIDFNRETPRFRNSTRDNCFYFFDRELNGVPELMHCDSLGNIWRMDQADKNKDGLGYDSTFQTTFMDFGDPTIEKNGEFIEIAFEPTGSVDLSIDVIWDGVYQETTTIQLSADDDVIAGRMVLNKSVPLVGSGQRLCLIGRNNNADEDFAIQGMWIHWSHAGDTEEP